MLVDLRLLRAAGNRREHGFRCAYYEVVGYTNDGWRFCFGRSGKMDGGAMGESPPPKH